jgi:hypothetical protein
MGQQQLLLIVLGVIIVGVAIVAGIGLFNAGAEESAKDELVAQSITIASNAQQYYRRPIAMGGGGNSFAGYLIPEKMQNTANGNYTATVTATSVEILGDPNAPLNYNWTVTTTALADTIYTVIQ